jgi:hypothetical protein
MLTLQNKNRSEILTKQKHKPYRSCSDFQGRDYFNISRYSMPITELGNLFESASNEEGACDTAGIKVRDPSVKEITRMKE